jgi:hypothetical protein
VRTAKSWKDTASLATHLLNTLVDTNGGFDVNININAVLNTVAKDPK